MKKKLMLLLGAMIMIATVLAVMISIITSQADTMAIKTEDKLQIVTTFYPVYMIGLNIADQVDNIEVKSLTELNTGCLHDYQLTTEDMKIISNADVMIINGGGMEGFLEDVASNYPELTIIDTSEGITMLPNVNGIGFEQEENDEHMYNSHLWLDPKLYIQQIENVRDGLIKYLADSNSSVAGLKEQLEDNAQTYIHAVQKLDAEIEETSKSIASSSQMDDKQAVIFHDAFAYLANRVGLTVAFTVPLDSDTALSAGDIAEIIKVVNEDKIKYLFTEQQYSDSIAKQIAIETGAKVYIIDSAVTGDGLKDSYLRSMEKNLGVLKDALK